MSLKHWERYGWLYALLIMMALLAGTFALLNGETQRREDRYNKAKILCQDVPGRDYQGCISQQKDILKRNQENDRNNVR